MKSETEPKIVRLWSVPPHVMRKVTAITCALRCIIFSLSVSDFIDIKIKCIQLRGSHVLIDIS